MIPSLCKLLTQPIRSNVFFQYMDTVRHIRTAILTHPAAYVIAFYRRQKCGVKRISTVKISSRPTSMPKVHTQV